MDHHLAAFDTLLGNHDAAINRIEAAIAIYQRLHSPLYKTLAAEVLVTALVQRGHKTDYTEAASIRRTAIASASALHLDALTERLEHVAR